MVLQRSQVIERNWFRLDGWMPVPLKKRDSDVTLQLNHRKVLEGHLVVFLLTGNETNISYIYIHTIFFTWCLDIVQYSKLLTQSLLLLVFVWSGSPFSNATIGRGKTFDDFQMPHFRRNVAENRRELLTGIQSHCQKKEEVRSEVSPKSDT